MNARVLLTAVGALTFAWPAASFAVEPPVQVDVVTDDAPDDFFAEPEAPAEETVKDRADKMFHDLEAEEAGKDTGLGGPRRSKDEARGTSATVTPQGDGQEVQVEGRHKKKRHRRRWWSRVNKTPGRGDVMLWVQGGGHAAGGFGGMGLEVMMTNKTGLRLSFQGTFFDASEFRNEEEPSSNWNFFSDGRWAGLRQVSPRNTFNGRAHLVDLSFTRHLIKLWRFDVYGAAGVSHFGYDIDFKDGQSRGGEGYGRLGAGANFHWGRIFAGCDFGWYPLALFRHGEDPVTGESGFLDIPTRWDSRRIVTSAHLGFRF